MTAATIDLSSLLVCPACRGTLRWPAESSECESCGRIFPLQADVPNFLGRSAEMPPTDHVSNPLSADFEKILREGHDFVLHIGAGATTTRYPNCVEFEYKIFRNTDVVGDAHHLPFRDGAFDRVFAFNVFEHLRDPKSAALEIQRVLKPGGIASIHTAFLQPLHEAPHHFYNATEFGVREWFSSFEIEACQVSGNFGPGVMLSFLCANVLEAARSGEATAEEQKLISRTTVGEWASWWANPEKQPAGFAALQRLPQEMQKRVAAGFELVARKPQDG